MLPEAANWSENQGAFRARGRTIAAGPGDGQWSQGLKGSHQQSLGRANHAGTEPCRIGIPGPRHKPGPDLCPSISTPGPLRSSPPWSFTEPSGSDHQGTPYRKVPVTSFYLCPFGSFCSMRHCQLPSRVWMTLLCPWLLVCARSNFCSPLSVQGPQRFIRSTPLS